MLNDIRHAIRSLAKSPGLVLVVVLCLGLGVGANTTIFSLTNAVFLRPLQVREPDRLVRLYSGWNDQRYRSSSYVEYQALSAQRDVFEGVAAYRTARVSVGQGEDVTMEHAMTATGNYFQVLGVTPALGRFFTPAEDRTGGADPVVVVSHAFWQARLASDPAVAGRALHISGRPYTIVGVLPKEFFGIEPDQEVAVWLPFMTYRHIVGAGDEYLSQGWHGLAMVGRLKTGVSIERARVAAASAAKTVAAAHGSEWETLRFSVLRGGTLANTEGSAEIRIVFILLNAVVGLVLLIACANIANILLARGMSRRREIAIRLSLGSGRLRLIRQLLVESVLLGLAGGVVGLLLALWGADLLQLFQLPTAIDPTPDVRVFAYTFTIATLTGIIFGFVPALQATRIQLADTLKQTSRLGAPIRSRLRGALVVGQISLSVLLLVLAGLFLRAIFELRSTGTGIVERGMLAVELDLTTLNLPEEQGKLLFDRVQERLSGLPGIESATLSTMVPSSGRQWMTGATLPEVEQFSKDYISISYNTIGLDYFRTMGTPVLLGRTLSAPDRQGQPLVTLVNEALVNRYFPNGNPLGKHIRAGENRVWEIVGVVGDIRYESAGYAALPTMFVSYQQQYEPNLTLQVRTRGQPSALIAPIRRELLNLQPGLAGTYRTFDQIRRESEVAPRLVSTLLTVFGALALLLAALGLYGVTAYVVALRTHEIGVRMALGARPAGVLGLMARHGLRLALLGSIIGLALSFVAGHLLATALYGVSPFDPLTIAAVVLVMGSISVVASLVPARRAARVDPLIALRAD